MHFVLDCLLLLLLVTVVRDAIVPLPTTVVATKSHLNAVFWCDYSRKSVQCPIRAAIPFRHLFQSLMMCSPKPIDFDSRFSLLCARVRNLQFTSEVVSVCGVLLMVCAFYL